MTLNEFQQEAYSNFHSEESAIKLLITEVKGLMEFYNETSLYGKAPDHRISACDKLGSILKCVAVVAELNNLDLETIALGNINKVTT